MRARIGLATATCLALVVAACGGDDGTADPTATTAAGTPTTTSGGSGGTTATTAPAPSGGDEGRATVTIDGTTYELSMRDDIAIPGTGTNFPTQCVPNFFGSGQFVAGGVAVDENGDMDLDPQVGFGLRLFPTVEAAEASGRELTFGLNYSVPDGSSGQDLDYVMANSESLVLQGITFDGDVGSWTIEGNRIHGEIVVYEYDHIREYFTATFDVTCPG